MENFGGRRRFGGRRFGGGYSSQDKPVKEGETYDVEIIEVGSRGDGIAKIQNFVIFVPGTQKGDKVKIRITKVRSTSAVGEVVSSEGEQEKIVVEEPAEEEAEEESEEPSEEPMEEPEEEQPEEEPESEESEEQEPSE
jgi:predicted RNA-binding protein with TRAM domain